MIDYEKLKDAKDYFEQEIIISDGHYAWIDDNLCLFKNGKWEAAPMDEEE
jgi:hypothetical protein